MGSRAEEQFWGYPDKFMRTGNALQWSPRVRLITIRNGDPIVTAIPSGRLWSRICDGRESEVRFRFTNTAAVRSAFPTDIDDLTVLVVDRVDDLEADGIIDPPRRDEDAVRPQRYLAVAGASRETHAFLDQPPGPMSPWLFNDKDLYRDPHGLPNIAAVQNNVNVMQKLGYLKASLDVRPYFDLSVVQDAGKRLQ